MFVWTEDEFFFSQPHVMGRAFDSAGQPVTEAFPLTVTRQASTRATRSRSPAGATSSSPGGMCRVTRLLPRPSHPWAGASTRARS